MLTFSTINYLQRSHQRALLYCALATLSTISRALAFPLSEHMSSSTPTELAFTSWDDRVKEIALKTCIPPLSSSSYKGSSGRVAVLGGSAQYTGAPYYAAMSALKTGSDLAFVFCADEAATAIKCYSPELMVAPVYNAKEFDEVNRNGNNTDTILKDYLVDKMVERVNSFLPKIHCLIIGPGLGRCPIVLEATAKIIKAALDAEVSLVIDADGLYLLSLNQYKDLLSCVDLSANKAQVILTPNIVEYRRLVELFCSGKKSSTGLFLGTPLERCIIIKKGKHDHVFTPRDPSTGVYREMYCEEQGGLKRSGGIGDVLAGATGTFVAWNRILHKDLESSHSGDILLSCWSAACLTKRATHRAFNRKRRSMTAPDILEDIGEALDDMTKD